MADRNACGTFDSPLLLSKAAKAAPNLEESFPGFWFGRIVVIYLLTVVIRCSRQKGLGYFGIVYVNVCENVSKVSRLADIPMESGNDNAISASVSLSRPDNPHVRCDR